MNKNFWKGKRVLVTGDKGFKGAWLLLVLDGYVKVSLEKNYFSPTSLMEIVRNCPAPR